MPFEFSPEQIADYVAAVEMSGAMGKSQRRLRLLQHLILAENQGEGGGLKAYSIGLDVFDKSASFDPSNDSIVRVEIGRLRTAIAVFEGSDFARTELQVSIPVGTYRPVLSMREQPQSEPRLQDLRPVFFKPMHRTGRQVLAATLVAVAAVLVFVRLMQPAPVNTTPDAAAITVIMGAFEGDAVLAKRAEAIIKQSLLRNKSFRLLDALPPERVGGTAYVLNGYVDPISQTAFRLDIDLIDVVFGQIIWSKSARIAQGEGSRDAIEDSFASELSLRLFGAAKDELAQRDVDSLSPQELFIMATWVPGPAQNAIEWEHERIALVQRALAQDPAFGTAHSVLADKLRYLANVDAVANTAENAADARMHIQRAIELEPMNADAMFNVAQAQWHGGDVSDSILSMERVLELNPGHQLADFLRHVIPYTCAAPPSDVIAAAIGFDAALAADNPIRWLTLTWISWLHSNAGSYAEALVYEEAAALIFEVPYSFMRHAMILNELSRPDDAAAVLRRQRENWPDVGPDFFASTTYPRLCAEVSDGSVIIAPYEALAQAMRTRSPRPE